eukprot:6178413-Pleurochrysis_carterae.AAC.3
MRGSRARFSLDVRCSAITKSLLFRREETTTLLKRTIGWHYFWEVEAALYILVAVFSCPTSGQARTKCDLHTRNRAHITARAGCCRVEAKQMPT